MKLCAGRYVLHLDLNIPAFTLPNLLPALDLLGCVVIRWPITSRTPSSYVGRIMMYYVYAELAVCENYCIATCS